MRSVLCLSDESKRSEQSGDLSVLVLVGAKSAPLQILLRQDFSLRSLAPPLRFAPAMLGCETVSVHALE